jgi:16S rRNA (guanine527-N7)-methyltransferase
MFHVKQQWATQLRQLAHGAGLEVDERSSLLCAEYLDLLLEANKRVNLTRITEPQEALRLHMLDSLLALPELGLAPEGELLDLGSGGGLPGVPLAVASGRQTTLLDSIAKKAGAVADILEALGLDSLITTCPERAEAHSLSHPSHYAAVVARAVAPLPSLVELAAPLLIDGGHLIALKGRPETMERESGAAASRVVGMEEISWRETWLPPTGETRTIVVYGKCGDSVIPLPRRSGMAQKRPLA